MIDLLQSLGVVQSLVVFVLFVAATLNIGLALPIDSARTRNPALDLCVAVAFGFLVLGLCGLVVWVSPAAKRLVAVVLLLATNGAAAYVNWRRRPAVVALLKGNTFVLATWLAVSLSLLVIAQLPIPPRANLPDGLYAFKRWTLPVRLQVMTVLPSDNAVPAFAAEYMARGTSFSDVRPLMPGQEVSNRPLYEALVYLPFRATFGTTEPAPSPYPSYVYVTVRWPDTSQLISDNSFAKFLAVAIPLNASLLLALGALLGCLSIPHARLCLIAFGALSPYLLQHSIFTWPKNLAAFYLVVAVLFLMARGPPAIAGLFIGLAYLAHPYALAFIVALAIATAIELGRAQLFATESPVIGISVSKGQLLQLWLALVATVAPWHLWTLLVLHIPSDLVSQNIGHAQSAGEMLYARVGNLAATLLPTFLLPSTLASPGLRGAPWTSLVIAVGVVPLIFIPWALVRTARELPLLAVWLCLVSGLMLVAVFGDFGAKPLLHGWQSIWPGLLALTLLAMSRRFGPGAVLIACYVQLPLNVSYLIVYALSF